MNHRPLARKSTPVPAKKPLDQHKQTYSFSLDPLRRKWVRENFERLNYRSESHMMDDILRQYIEEKPDSRSAGKDCKRPGQ